MNALPGASDASVPVEGRDLERFCRQVLRAAGADVATADAATRAMMHGSRLGVDSHGVRLLAHYAQVLGAGRVNARPEIRVERRGPAVATLDADHGHGALAAYRAMETAVDLARTAGLGAVSIRNSSHFGPAGAFAFAAAEAGSIGLAVCNSDSFVRLHEGAERFHGTNPLAVAVPVAGSDPWLFDMATSAIPYNRVQLYRSLGLGLPDSVASDGDGRDTRDPGATEMLAPLGAAFGFKGAGLAGLVEILSAVLSGMRLSFDILPMAGPDLSTPREMGAFVMAIRPDAFVERSTFDAGMARYLGTLRRSRPVDGGRVMAPGDREWVEARRREITGIPIDPETRAAFLALGAQFRLAVPKGLVPETAAIRTAE